MAKKLIPAIIVLILAACLTYVGVAKTTHKVYESAEDGSDGAAAMFQKADDRLLIKAATMGAASRAPDGRLIGDPTQWESDEDLACPT